MPAPILPIPLTFAPGIQRDNTELDADRALDARWTRWRNNRPRKVGGYRRLTNQLNGIPRKIHMLYGGTSIIVHVGTASGIQQVVLNPQGVVQSIADRTPAAFSGGPEVGWTIDAIFDGASNLIQLVAHAVPDLELSSSSIATIPFIGQIDSPTPLTPLSNPTPSSGIYNAPLLAGGIFVSQPFLFGFDAAGRVLWSAANLPNYLGVTEGSSGAGEARESAQKIVAGMPLRGGGVNSPAAIFWSLSEVITASFVGTPLWFAFNTVSPSSSILGTDVVIEYDGLYFWAASDRFLVYNGTVVEVPNFQNQDWFFENLNRDFAAKTFAFKVPRYGEIWWCAPMFGATEPSHAIIYNLRENYWYDTELPADFRSAGYFAQGFRYPIMGSAVSDGVGYKLWLHETGTDAIDGTSVQPIQAYFETPYLTGPKSNPPDDRSLSIESLEPDIIQMGDMTVTVVGAANARAGDYADPAVALKAIPGMPQEQLVGFKTERRLPRLRFESNTLGGSFISGKNILHGRLSDRRITGGPAPTPGAS